MTKNIRSTKKPTLKEISFEGNMPSTYEKNLKKVLAKSAVKRRKK